MRCTGERREDAPARPGTADVAGVDALCCGERLRPGSLELVLLLGFSGFRGLLLFVFPVFPFCLIFLGSLAFCDAASRPFRFLFVFLFVFLFLFRLPFLGLRSG